MHYAHGFLSARFLSPLANDRTDGYGGSSENRSRFLVETFDAPRAAWPKRLPMTMRTGATGFHPDSRTLEDSIDLLPNQYRYFLNKAMDVSHGATHAMQLPVRHVGGIYGQETHKRKIIRDT